MAQFAFAGVNEGLEFASRSWIYFLLNQDVWYASSTGGGSCLIASGFRSSKYGGVDIPDQGLPSNLRGMLVRFSVQGGPAWHGLKRLKLDLPSYSWEGRVELSSDLPSDFAVEGRVYPTNAHGGFKDALLFGGPLANTYDPLEEAVERHHIRHVPHQ